VIDENPRRSSPGSWSKGGAADPSHEEVGHRAAEDDEGDVFFLDDQSPGPPSSASGKENTEGSLATPYSKEIARRAAAGDGSDAWLTIQEQGVNTLFLALGVLQWKEEEGLATCASRRSCWCRSELERKTARSFWQLSATDEDAGFNLSLAEKMRDLGVKLPPSPPLETAEDLEKVFALVEEASREDRLVGRRAIASPSASSASESSSCTRISTRRVARRAKPATTPSRRDPQRGLPRAGRRGAAGREHRRGPPSREDDGGDGRRRLAGGGTGGSRRRPLARHPGARPGPGRARRSRT
jgi:hypothetical protein